MINPFIALRNFHDKLGHSEAVANLVSNPDHLRKWMELRIKMIEEELIELKTAVEEKDAEGIVDALIDGAYFNLGTLDYFLGPVGSMQAFEEVHSKNMVKEPGVKPNRPNPLNLPDAIKPEGWTAPDLSPIIEGSQILEELCK